MPAAYRCMTGGRRLKNDQRRTLRLKLILRLIAASAVTFPLLAHAAADRFAPVGAFLNAHCVECHGVKSKKADLALNLYKDEVSVLKDRKLFQQAIEMVHEGEMPPAKR